MHFTQEDYRKIEDWLYQRTVKDTEFPSADLLDGTEMVPILQNNKNKTIGLNDFVKQVADMKLPDFYNVTVNSKRPYLTLKEAVSLVPVKQRKLGLTITYHNEYGNWLIYQFKGDSLNQWDSLNYWNNIIQQAIESLSYPDEEDITGVRDGNRTFLKFKNREYNPEEFSGMGMIILRKNLVGTAACSIDDEDHLSNILTQDMINQENTVYIVQYDFDLDGKVISIPKGCTLWFQGGSINNGTIYLQETAILGAFEFADMGTAKLFGKFNTGQIMTFSNDSYKAKEGGYFIPSTKSSSATPQEDAKQDREVFYDKNPDAYTTEIRQELRWWNGEEWILILDITDYNELKSIINDLIEKHNTEMSACYKYFKARCYALELRVDNAEERIDTINQEITNIYNDISNIRQSISNLTEIINNLDQTIENHIQRFIENNVIGVASITVNGTKYEPDSNGNITLPDYPEGGSGGGQADSVKGTLTVKSSTGETLTTYNGSEDKILTLPSGEGAGAEGIASKVAHKLKFTGASTAEYDGSEEVTVNIPVGGSGGGNADDIAAHKADINNPHHVTKEQLGLDKVNNTSDADKPVSSATQAALDVISNSLESHIEDQTNPHHVTKEQLGLGNVDNTSDKDKPISDAAQNLFDTKVDKIIGKGLSTNDFTNEDKAKLDNSMSNRKLTSEEIENLTSKNVGDLVYNTTINKYVYWNGTSWEEQVTNSEFDTEMDALDAVIDTKVDKVAGKGLSANDFTDDYKGILDNPWGETIE